MIVLLQLQLSVSDTPKDLWTSSVRFVLFAIATSRAWAAIDPQCGAVRRGACLAYNSRSAVRTMQRTPHECTASMSAVRSGFRTVDSDKRSFLVRRQRCAPGVCAKEGRSILLGDGPHISTRAAGSRRPPRQAAHTMYVARCMLHAICARCMLQVACCMLHVACCTLYVARCAGLRNPPAQLPFHICPGPGHSPSSISVPRLPFPAQTYPNCHDLRLATFGPVSAQMWQR